MEMSLKMLLLLAPKAKCIIPEGIDIEDDNYFVRFDEFGKVSELVYDLMEDENEYLTELFN